MLSFDGTMMGISHHSADDNGRSVVYTLPSTGGTPKRITAKSPSYFHSWSPDNKWLIYTGQRDDELDIYKISADGGEEIRLTTADRRRRWVRSTRRTASGSTSTRRAPAGCRSGG